MYEKLPPEYPLIHIYPQQKPRQPVIIKSNIEGIRSLIFALTSALVYEDKHGMAEVFCGDAEAYSVIVKLVNTKDELSPLPYQE